MSDKVLAVLKSMAEFLNGFLGAQELLQLQNVEEI